MLRLRIDDRHHTGRALSAFLTEDLDRRLQAEIVRDAISQYLHGQTRPWPRSVGVGENADRAVASENVKGWVPERWRPEMDEPDESDR